MQISLKYRPQNFDEVVGQDVSCRILKNSILMSRQPKALLFSGLHGVGKTSLARIYAKSLNCSQFAKRENPCCECTSCIDVQNGTHPNVIEMDAASNNGVDDVRRVEEVARGVVSGGYRVFIFDEAQMLSKSAQAALLKLIEEPPDRTIFILVTTDPQKLESTVRSRCLSMPLKSLNPSDLENIIKKVVEEEGYTCETGFSETLSLYGNGSVRDVQQILDQILLSSSEKILSLGLLQDQVGIITTKQYQELATCLISKDTKYFLNQIKSWYKAGVDLVYLFEVGIPNIVRDFMVHGSGAYSDGIFYYSGLTEKSLERNLSLSYEEVKNISREWNNTLDIMKFSNNPRVVFDMFAGMLCG